MPGQSSTSVLGSIVVSIPACHAGDPGSIPGRGVNILCSATKYILYFEKSANIVHMMLFYSKNSLTNFSHQNISQMKEASQGFSLHFCFFILTGGDIAQW